MKIRVLCKCPALWHDIDLGEPTNQFLTEVLSKKGHYQKITSLVSGRSYRVPIGYILYHGLSEDQLDHSGFDLYEREGIN